MHPTVTDRLAMREYARGIGDTGLERACNADLARHGHRDEPLETTLPVEVMERAVPEKPRRGRPPRPRCEHNQIIGRCVACEEEGVDDE